MKEKGFKNKINSLLLHCGCLLVLATALFVFGAPDTQAANSGNTFDYAWSEAVGWIRFDGASSTESYGASINNNGMSGLAWNENAGWIKLSGSCSEAGGCPGGGTTYGITLAGSCSVGTACLTGYAWGEGTGWLKFAADSSDYSNSTTSTSTYGVYIDASGGFHGYAWGDSIGWVKFAGSCSEAGGCPAGGSAYGVNTTYWPKTEFVSIIDPGDGAGTDYTSLSAWEGAVQADLTATNTLVFLYDAATASGTIPDGASVIGETSGAIASTTHRTATTTSHQIMLKNIASSTFIAGEKLYILGASAVDNYVVLSNSGEGVIAVASVRSSNGSADQTAVTIDGWTTSATNYVKIWTDPTTGARHNGKWDDGKYRLVANAAWESVIHVTEEYVRLDGLQVENTAAGSNPDGVEWDGSVGEINFSNNIIRNGRIGFSVDDSTGGTSKAWNNIIYDYSSNGIRSYHDSDTGTFIAHNNTVYTNLSAYTGIYIQNASVVILKNNIVQIGSSGSHSTGYDYSLQSNGSQTTANNISENATSPDVSYRNKTVNFIDETNKNLHLISTDTIAKDNGTSTVLWDSNLNFTQDIDGSYRGAAWDIGADEVPTEFVSTICESTTAGGDCANRSYSTLSAWEAAVDSNLTASGTRVFSGTASGTVSASAVTLYDESGASTGITGTIVATTSNQILVINIIGTTTPVSVASGSSWRISSSNTWRNSGTADQLGASPIAVAKIDGAWTNPDTTAVTITGWTTSYDNYIKIYSTPTARHKGIWNTNAYRLEYTNNEPFSMQEEYTWVDGIQIKSTLVDTNDVCGIYANSSSGVNSTKMVISNNIIRGVYSGTSSGGSAGICTYNNLLLIAYNNVIYDIINGVADVGGGIRIYGTNMVAHLYNNTVYNSYRGLNRAQGTVIAKNNLAYNNTVNYNGAFNASSTNNLSGPTQTDAPGSSPQNAKVVNFISTSTADFHLADTDTSAKGQGTNLSAEKLSFEDPQKLSFLSYDIDGASRPPLGSDLPWDIGADQTAVKIYRSIAPSATTALTTGASNAVTISSTTSLATFATALADNIGVGDVIIYNTGGSATATAFIHGRSSSTVYTVKTASGTAPTAVSGDTSWSIYRAYTTLANAEAGTENTGIANATIRNFDTWSGGADLVASNTQWNIAAYANGTTADTANVVVDGWTTGQQNYIKINTPILTSEVGTSQRHQGKWDTGKYRLDASAESVLLFTENYTIIEGIQFKLTLDTAYDARIIRSEGNDIEIKNNIIVANLSGSPYGAAIQSWGRAKIWNNILYSVGEEVVDGVYNASGDILFAYNNTVVNFGVGFFGWGVSTETYINNISYNNVDNYDIDSTNGANNLSGPSQTDAPGSNPVNAAMVSFVDEANNDFHLAPTDTAALDQGTSTAADANLAVTDDIDEQLRRTPDIGADEASVEYVTSVMEAGGNFSTLSSWEAANQVDLATTSTAVFSLSSANGTIPASASVMGLTSGAVASTTVGSVSTSTQILLYNIASSTFISGETVYIKGSATTSNYVIISNAGNPAIATAKIDGAWANPDTTRVTIEGWTSGPTNYIRIYTAPASRHNGKWDAGKYSLDYTADGDYQNGIRLSEGWVYIDGLQVRGTYTNRTGGYALFLDQPDAMTVYISNNLIRGVIGGTSSGQVGVRADYEGVNGTRIVKGWNNIVSGNFRGCVDAQHTGWTTSYWYNNVVSGCTYTGFWTSGASVLKNNISYDNADNYNGTFHASSTNNLSGPTQTDAPGTNPRNGVTVQFVDAANNDFHLAPTDTAAKDAAADLSADANLIVNTDIEGQARGTSTATSTAGGLGWDIGADEGATIMYRSVGNISADLNSGAATITISNSAATFSAALANNIGVGDVIQYGNPLALAFITGRSSSTVYSIVSATGSYPVATSSAAAAIYRAHTLLNNWQTQTTGTVNQSISAGLRSQVLVARDLVASNTAMFVAAYASTSPDNTAAGPGSWTTGTGNYIKIYTPVTSAEVGISQRHQGKWDNTKFRLEISNNYRPIYNQVNHIWFDGLQISNDTAADYGVGMLHRPNGGSTSTEIRISNNIIRTTVSPTYIITGLDLSYGAIYKVWNNILYDFSNSSANGGIFIWNDPSNGLSVTYLYNNTIYNSYIGMRNAGSGTTTAINNIVVGSGNTNAYLGTFSNGTDYNATDGTDNIGQGTHNKTGQTFNFIDLVNRDFHLAPTDRAARDSGLSLAGDTYLPFSTDIDGNTRPYAGTWDIGADEDAASNPDYRFNGLFKLKGFYKFR